MAADLGGRVNVSRAYGPGDLSPPRLRQVAFTVEFGDADQLERAMGITGAPADPGYHRFGKRLSSHQHRCVVSGGTRELQLA